MSQYAFSTILAGQFTVLIEYSGNNPLYIGKARAGTGESETRWQIQRLTYSGANMIAREWANGDADFIFAWTARATFSYS
jgi:hypothetical protein